MTGRSDPPGDIAAGSPPGADDEAPALDGRRRPSAGAGHALPKDDRARTSGPAGPRRWKRSPRPSRRHPPADVRAVGAPACDPLQRRLHAAGRQPASSPFRRAPCSTHGPIRPRRSRPRPSVPHRATPLWSSSVGIGADARRFTLSCTPLADPATGQTGIARHPHRNHRPGPAERWAGAGGGVPRRRRRYAQDGDRSRLRPWPRPPPWSGRHLEACLAAFAQPGSDGAGARAVAAWFGSDDADAGAADTLAAAGLRRRRPAGRTDPESSADAAELPPGALRAALAMPASAPWWRRRCSTRGIPAPGCSSRAGH